MTHKISRRQFLRVAGASAGAAMMAACNAPLPQTPGTTIGSEADPTASAVTAPEPANIKWWQYPLWEGVTGQETKGLSPDDPKRADYTAADWPNWVAGEFAKQYPGFNCSVEMLTWQEGRDKLTVAATTGAGRPNIFLEDGPVILKFVRAGAMLPVTLSADDQEDFFPGALSAGTHEGQLWYRPWLGGSRMLLVNRAIFQERGVEDLIPTDGDRLWTYEQFLEAARATSFTRDSGEEVFGFTSHFAHFAAHFWVDSFLWGYGASIFDESGLKVVIDSPEAARGLQFVADLQNKYQVMPPGSAGMQDSDVKNMFYQGRLGMMLGSHSSAERVRKAKDDGTIPDPDAVDVYPIMYPADLPQQKPAVFTVFMGFGLFDTGTDAEQDAAAEFIAFLTNKENSEAPIVARALPARKSAEDAYAGDDFMLYAMRAMNYGHLDTVSPYFDAVSQFLNPMWQAALTGERTPEEALAEAQERSNAFIEEEEAKKTGA